MGRIAGWIAGILAIGIALAAAGLFLFRPAVPTKPVISDFRIYSTPALPPTLNTPQAQVSVAALASMSLEQRIRSLLIVSKPGTDASSLDGFLSVTGAGGFILMKPNVPATPAELSALDATLRGNSAFPRLIAIDEEGGVVTRLPYDAYAGAETLRDLPVTETQVAFTHRGALLAQVGANLNFGIVADISADPQSFIYSRSFGKDPASVAERVAAAVTGEKKSGVLSTLKHFPGHGAAPGDSHTSVPSTGMDFATWKSTEAVPFLQGVTAGAPTVMFGHLAYTAVDTKPASLSTTWHEILREKLGFTGLAVTDDMLMLQRTKLPEFADANENAVRAITAGNDVLVYVFGDDPASSGVNIDQLVGSVSAAVASGRISEQRINEAALRVMTARRGLSASAASDPQACNIGCTIGYSLLFPHSAHK